jgi:hypothetical protein
MLTLAQVICVTTIVCKKYSCSRKTLLIPFHRASVAVFLSISYRGLEECHLFPGSDLWTRGEPVVVIFAEYSGLLQNCIPLQRWRFELTEQFTSSIYHALRAYKIYSNMALADDDEMYCRRRLFF